MVVDFSVWADSEAVAASFSTAITPAALTIPSGGAAPAISSEHIVSTCILPADTTGYAFGSEVSPSLPSTV
eukprot:COSAG06_NODE_39351_length_413_cov_1.786624_1_plen_70_part_10